MCKISFEHPSIDEWYEKTGEGTSTFDVCNRCFCGDGFGYTAESLGLTDNGYNGDPIPADAIAVETGSDIPDISMPLGVGVDYRCEVCACKLTSENYYL